MSKLDKPVKGYHESDGAAGFITGFGTGNSTLIGLLYGMCLDLDSSTNGDGSGVLDNPSLGFGGGSGHGAGGLDGSGEDH